MDFPDLKSCKDPDKANYQNYLAWQAQTAARRRESQTQFNLYQSRYYERMSHQAQFKDEIEREIERNKDIVERRLSLACDCDNCGETGSTRSSSFSSTGTTQSPLSPRSSNGRDSIGSAMTQSSQGEVPPGTTVRGPTSANSRNSLVVSHPPRSRHHQRQSHSTSTP